MTQSNVPEVLDTTAEGHEHAAPSAMIHVVAPLAALAATWVVRRAMNGGYRALSGHKAPEGRDLDVSWTRALVWTAVTASAAAMVEVAIYRYISSRENR